MKLRNLKNALPLIAGALANKTGVKVETGNGAATDGGTITLPPLDGDDIAIKRKALGFISHESAHVSDTDMDVWNREIIAKPIKRDVMNVLEDIRIEKKQGIRLPGCATYLKELVETLVAEEGFVKVGEESHPALIMSSWMLYKLRHDVLEQHAIAPLLEETDAVFQKVIPKGMAVRLEALMFEVEGCKSTQDVADLSETILLMVEEEKQKEQEEEQKQEELEQQRQQQEQQQQEQQQPGGQGEGAGESEPDPTQQASGPAGAGQDEEVQSGGQGAGSSLPKASDVLEKMLSATVNDATKGIGEIVMEQFNKNVDINANLRVFNAGKQKNLGVDTAYDFKVRATVNSLKHRLHTMLQATTRSSKRVSSQGLKMSNKHLHQVRITGNIFEKKTRGQSIDTAASFLIDGSGSMKSMIGFTAEAAYAVASALDSVMGVNVAVGLFPTPSGMDYLTGFGEKPASRAKNFSSISANGGTPMSDALARTTIDLLTQPQKRKIQFLITDGQPAYDSVQVPVNGSQVYTTPVDQTKDVIAAANAAGIEVYGIGIGVDLSHLFDQWCTINSLEDLPNELFGLLQVSMRQAA